MDDRVQHRGITVVRHGTRWRWQARSGRRVATFSSESLEEALSALDTFVEERERTTRRAYAGSMSVRELCDQWFALKKTRLAPATARDYDQMIRVHIGPQIGSLDANAVRPMDLDAFYNSRRYKAARNSHVVLRQAFEWGLRNGILRREGNPALSARPDRKASIDYDGGYAFDAVKPVGEKDVPTDAEVHKLLLDAEHLADRRWWLYLMLATTTGARPGEVCALRRQDIDVEAGVVRIRWNADRVGGALRPPKRRHSIRSLSVGADFLQRIQPALPKDPEAFLFPAGGYQGAKSRLPCWSSRTVKRRLDDALQRTGLPHYTPHSFRHFVATRLLVATKDTVQVARFLGHQNDSLVRALYANHLHDDMQRALGLIAARLAPS